MTIREDVGAFLVSHADEGYRAFQAKLIPNIDAATIVGVRTPELRKFAKGLARREDAGEFLAALSHGTACKCGFTYSNGYQRFNCK